jgi:hypothetical protein
MHYRGNWHVCGLPAAVPEVALVRAIRARHEQVEPMADSARWHVNMNAERNVLRSV